MSPESVLDRIAKIVALAQDNPSEAEGAVALAKARELLVRHGLSMAEVTAYAEERAASATTTLVTEVRSPTMTRPEAWKRQLAVVIAEYTMTRAIISTRRFTKEFNINFIGTPEMIASAAFLYGEFIQIIEASAKAQYKQFQDTPSASFQTIGRKAWMRHYSLGYVYGLGEQMDDLKAKDTPEVTAMIVASDARITDYIEQQYPSLRTNTPRDTRLDESAYIRGIADGIEADIPDFPANRLNVRS